MLQDAVKYTLDAEEKLKRFLDDPSIPIDNGSAERIIRKVATGRRAWLFCDTPDGARALALFYSLVVTAQLNNANDYYYVKYLCERIPGGLLGPVGQLSDEILETLMPWSEEYKAYEKHEIESRYDAVILGNDMNRPTKEDILEMRRQMEATTVSADSGETVKDKSHPNDTSETPDDAPELPKFSVNDRPDAQPLSAPAVSSNIYENTLIEAPAPNPEGNPIRGEPDTRDGPVKQRTNVLADVRDEEIRRRTG